MASLWGNRRGKGQMLPDLILFLKEESIRGREQSRVGWDDLEEGSFLKDTTGSLGSSLPAKHEMVPAEVEE